MSDRLVWIDCEMTGLDLGADALVEVAALVTDFELNVLGEGIDVIIKPSQESLDQMVEFVRSMHEKSGLLDELAAVSKALDRAGFAIVASGLQQCLAQGDGVDSVDVKKMEKLFLSLA